MAGIIDSRFAAVRVESSSSSWESRDAEEMSRFAVMGDEG